MVRGTSLPSCDGHFGRRQGRSRLRQIISQFITIIFDIIEAFSELRQTSKTERFGKPINVFQSLTIFVKHSILHV